MTNKEQLLDALDDSRERLLMAIETLPDEALLEKHAVGEWSVSDILINITAWEAELVTGLMLVQQNKRPDRLLQALKDPTGYDQQRFVENQDRDLDQVFFDLQHVRVQIEEWILEFSEQELNNPRRYQWLKGKDLKDMIAWVTIEREKKIVPLLQLFAQQWAILTMNTTNDVIPLETLTLGSQENTHEDTN